MTQYISIACAFILLAGTVVWMALSSGAWWLLKAAVILTVTWFGLVLLFMPGRFLGWPTPKIPDGLMILQYQIVEPIPPNEGGIYLWGFRLERTPDGPSADPREAFPYQVERMTPYSVALPYSKDKHKKLAEQSQEAEQKGQFIILKRKPKGAVRAKGEWSRWIMPEDDEFGLEMYDPFASMPRKEEE